MINDRIVFSLGRVRKLHTRAGSPKWSRGRGKVPFFSYAMNTLAIALIVAGAVFVCSALIFSAKGAQGVCI